MVRLDGREHDPTVVFMQESNRAHVDATATTAHHAMRRVYVNVFSPEPFPRSSDGGAERPNSPGAAAHRDGCDRDHGSRIELHGCAENRAYVPVVLEHGCDIVRHRGERIVAGPTRLPTRAPTVAMKSRSKRPSRCGHRYNTRMTSNARLIAIPPSKIHLLSIVRERCAHRLRDGSRASFAAAAR